jgi:CRISPR system Cascade subunit CasB
MTEENQIHPYIDYLYSLATNQRRGTLAELRRGLSEPPATAPGMFPYVARWVPEDDRFSWKEKVYYLIAALFAYYQSGGGVGSKQTISTGNLGDHCRTAVQKTAVQKETKSGSFEMRFTTLLKANTDDLPVFLRQMISVLKSADVPINWGQLFFDLTRWNSESHYIQRQWANSYWAYTKNPDQAKQPATNH